jgi:glutaminyl-peptide cyclotransferase
MRWFGFPHPFTRPALRTVLLAAVVVFSIVGVTMWVVLGSHGDAAAAAPRQTLEDIPFDGNRAYDYLKQLCAIGPRPSGSAGMEAQQQLLADHFRSLGGQVELQRFRYQHPSEQSPVRLANILVHWQPEKKDRILLCAHYDTLPYPLRDPENPRGRFIGANDNASGVAVLMELARERASLKCKYGVDFLLLDGEEYIFSEKDQFFLGSQYFAEEYAKNPPPYRYRWGVLLDMVGSEDLQLFQERNSLGWRDTHPLVVELWATAARLGVHEFIAKPKHDVRDDHVMLHEIGGIPCIDLIDFDYPPWHTQGDVPARCSALSLAKVGWVVQEWLKTVR